MCCSGPACCNSTVQAEIDPPEPCSQVTLFTDWIELRTWSDNIDHYFLNMNWMLYSSSQPNSLKRNDGGLAALQLVSRTARSIRRCLHRYSGGRYCTGGGPHVTHQQPGPSTTLLFLLGATRSDPA